MADYRRASADNLLFLAPVASTRSLEHIRRSPTIGHLRASDGIVTAWDCLPRSSRDARTDPGGGGGGGGEWLNDTAAVSPQPTVRRLQDPVHSGPSMSRLLSRGFARFFSSDHARRVKRASLYMRSRSLDMLLDERHYEELAFEEEVTNTEVNSSIKSTLKPEFVDFYTKVLQTLLHPLGRPSANDANPIQLAAHLQKVFNVPNEIHLEIMQDELGNEVPGCHLKVTVVEARDILGMDANGMSDPYCFLTLCRRQQGNSSSSPSHEKHLTHQRNSCPDESASTGSSPSSIKLVPDRIRRNSDQKRSFRRGGRKKSDESLTTSSASTLPVTQSGQTLTAGSGGGSSKMQRRKNSAEGSSAVSPRIGMHPSHSSMEAECVFKTTCQKATLHPIWNETFDILVPSINDTELILTMWDLDEETNLWQACKSLESDHKMAGIKNLFRHIKHGISKNTDDFLGKVCISLDEIPTATRLDHWYTLQIPSRGSSGPSNGGKCHVKLQFVTEEEVKGPWDGKLTSISRHILNCFAIQQGVAKLSQTLINLSSLLEFHHHQNLPARELSFSTPDLPCPGKDEVDASCDNAAPESSDNIQKAGEEKGEKDVNCKPGEEKIKEDPDSSLMDRALREAMFHVHAEMIAETTFSIYRNDAKDVGEMYKENPRFLSYEIGVTESSISAYIDHCMSPIGDCPSLFPPAGVHVLDILKSKCRLSNISSLLQMKVWKDRDSAAHRKVRQIITHVVEADTRRWLGNKLDGLAQSEGSLKPSDLLKLLEGLGDRMSDMMSLLLRPCKDYQNFFMKFTVDYSQVVGRQVDAELSTCLQTVLRQLNLYQVRYQKFAENIAESSKASLKLYMTVKKMHSVLKANNNGSSEGLELTNLHTWFQEALVFWLVTFKYETFDRVRKALEMDKDVALVHSVVKYSNSAVDTQSCFAKVTQEWQKIGFDGVDSRCMAITKITDLICEGAKLYATSIHMKLEQNGFYRSSGHFDIKDKLCITLNNIEHVRVYLDNLPSLLAWEQTVNSLADHHANPTAGRLTYSTLQRMTTKACRDVLNRSGLLERKIADKMCQEVHRVLGKVVNPKGDAKAKEEHLDDFFSYIDHNLETLYKQLMPQIFPRIVEEVWNAILRGIVNLMHIGRPPSYYLDLKETLEALEGYFQRPGLALEPAKVRGPQHSYLQGQLALNAQASPDLMLSYYKEASLNMATPGEYWGHLGVRIACKEEVGSLKTIIIKVCNAVELPGMDRNGTSDPFVVIEILPETVFDKPLVQQTRTMPHNLNPVFNEMFEIPSVPAELIDAGGVVSLTVMDHALIWSHAFIGEVFIPLQQARPISTNQSVDQCPVVMMPVKRPHATNDGAFEILKNRCKWDKLARQFYARRQKVMENQRPRTDKAPLGPPATNGRLAPFFRQ